jgi:hypothetical protein
MHRSLSGRSGRSRRSATCIVIQAQTVDRHFAGEAGQSVGVILATERARAEPLLRVMAGSSYVAPTVLYIRSFCVRPAHKHGARRILCALLIHGPVAGIVESLRSQVPDV